MSPKSMTTRTLRSSDMIIALTGFMGCGKSSVGRELSTLLGIPVVDLDRYIEQMAGKKIPDIFAESGESGFRELETDALYEVLSGRCAHRNVLLRRTPPLERSEGIIRCPAEAVCNGRPGAPVWREPVFYRAEGGTVSVDTSP